MKIDIVVTQKEIQEVLAAYVADKVGHAINAENVKLYVKSKNNYRLKTWEEAELCVSTVGIENTFAGGAGDLTMAGEIEVKRNGQVKRVRPVWQHWRPDDKEYPGYENAVVEMLESIRNVLESIDRRMQTLENRVNCHETLAIPRTLKKIEANTQRKKRARKVVAK